MNPFYYLNVWYGVAGMVNFQIIDLYEYEACIHEGYRLFSFPGRVATVCCVTNDETITREPCLKTAKLFMDGHYVTYEIDLGKCTFTTTYGNKPPCH